MKKVVFPPLPFCIGSYKLTRVKNAPEFVRYLEGFHFEENGFHRNDSYDKVSNHCVFVGVHFEYSHHFGKDEETYRNSYNMTALSKQFKKKIDTSGGKGSSSTT